MGADPLWGEPDALLGVSKSLVKVIEAGMASRSVGVEQVVVRLPFQSLLTVCVSGSKGFPDSDHSSIGSLPNPRQFGPSGPAPAFVSCA